MKPNLDHVSEAEKISTFSNILGDTVFKYMADWESFAEWLNFEKLFYLFDSPRVLMSLYILVSTY
jgi:hypothetical protein